MNWLLLRGLLREVRHWGDFPEVFASTMGIKPEQVHLMNLPGLGQDVASESPHTISQIAEEIRSQWLFLREKRPGPWSCLAMSLGAMGVLEWARLFPGELERLVLINTSASDLSLPWRRFSFFQLQRALRIMITPENEKREEEIYRLTSNGLEAAEKARAWASFSPDRSRFIKTGLRQLLAAGRFQSPQRLETPLLFLASKADTFVDFSCSQVMAEKYASPLRVHLTAGHDLPLDAPDWVSLQTRLWVDGKFS